MSDPYILEHSNKEGRLNINGDEFTWDPKLKRWTRVYKPGSAYSYLPITGEYIPKPEEKAPVDDVTPELPPATWKNIAEAKEGDEFVNSKGEKVTATKALIKEAKEKLNPKPIEDHRGGGSNKTEEKPVVVNPRGGREDTGSNNVTATGNAKRGTVSLFVTILGKKTEKVKIPVVFDPDADDIVPGDIWKLVGTIGQTVTALAVRSGGPSYGTYSEGNSAKSWDYEGTLYAIDAVEEKLVATYEKMADNAERVKDGFNINIKCTIIPGVLGKVGGKAYDVIDGLARKFKGGSNDAQKPKAEVESDEDIF